MTVIKSKIINIFISYDTWNKINPVIDELRGLGYKFSRDCGMEPDIHLHQCVVLLHKNKKQTYIYLNKSSIKMKREKKIL